MNITVSSGDRCCGQYSKWHLAWFPDPPTVKLRCENWTNEATDPSKEPTKTCSTVMIRSVYAASSAVVLGFHLTPHAVCLCSFIQLPFPLLLAQYAVCVGTTLRVVCSQTYMGRLTKVWSSKVWLVSFPDQFQN